MSALAEQDWLAGVNNGNVRGFYAELGVDIPAGNGPEVSVACFTNPQAHKNEDRHKSCSVNLGSGMWHCKTCGKGGNPYQAATDLGLSEARASELAKRYGLFLPGAEKPQFPDGHQLRRWRLRLQNSPDVLERAFVVKGWTQYGLLKSGVGWDGERFTFPIRDRRLKVCGLVRYLPGAERKTLAAKGSRRELFPCPERMSKRRPLFLVEGEPDAVAVRSCCHQAVGIPGTGGWRSEWAQRLLGFRIVMLVDADGPGRDLAERVAGVLPRVRVVDMDPSRDDGWDVGDMIAGCASEGGLEQAGRVLERLAA